MQAFTILYTSFCLFAIFFPRNYLSELSISFLPYHIAILLFLFVISLYKTRKIISSNRNNMQKRTVIITTLIVWITFFYYSNQFKNFYETPEGNIEVTNQSWFKILYANIHKDNKNYDDIKSTIETENPDLVMFVEFSENHYNHLKDFLKANYPHINSTTRSKKFIWSMVFSKLPIENRADDFPQWAWKYAYFQTKFKEKDYYIYLVHTSSPDDYTHFMMRNKQLETLWNDIKEQEKHRKSENIIIIWDFNLSPRSIYYRNFDKKYLSWFYNQTKKIPFLFTWALKELPIFRSQIDQARTHKSVFISDFKSIDIKGSDHKWFSLEISN